MAYKTSPRSTQDRLTSRTDGGAKGGARGPRKRPRGITRATLSDRSGAGPAEDQVRQRTKD